MKSRSKSKKNTSLIRLLVIILLGGLMAEAAYATTLLSSRWQQSLLNWQQAKNKYFSQQPVENKEERQVVLVAAANLLISYLQIMQQELGGLNQGKSVSFLLSSLQEFSDWWQGQLQQLVTASNASELGSVVDNWQKRWEATKVLAFKAGGKAALVELIDLNERLTALSDRLRQADSEGVLPADWQQFSSQDKKWQEQMEQARIALNLADSVLSQIEVTNDNSQELFYQFLVHLTTAKDSLVKAAEVLAQTSESQWEIIQPVSGMNAPTSTATSTAINNKKR